MRRPKESYFLLKPAWLWTSNIQKLLTKPDFVHQCKGSLCSWLFGCLRYIQAKQWDKYSYKNKNRKIDRYWKWLKCFVLHKNNIKYNNFSCIYGKTKQKKKNYFSPFLPLTSYGGEGFPRNIEQWASFLW